MPTYTFRNKRTNKVVEKQMSINDIVAFEAKHPNLQRIYKTLNIADPVGLGIQRPPSDFSKYVLGKVKATNPLGNVGDRRWGVKKEI